MLSRISPALIPHQQFHLGAWLLPVNDPHWYYFLPKENPNQITNPAFIESVDPPLKNLVEYLHQNGIRTTPSCSGHFRSKETYRSLYDLLLKDKEQIRTEGLLLKDIETNKEILFLDKDYYLPWTRTDFLNEVMDYQHHGVIGMHIENEDLKNDILEIDADGIEILERENIVLLLVYEDNVRDNLLTWKNITAEIKYVVENQHVNHVKNHRTIF